MKLFCTLTLLCSLTSAQSAPVVVGTLAAEGADAVATYRNSIGRNFREANPLARPFVTKGPVILGGYFALDAGGKLGLEWWLRKRGHRKIARAVEIIGIGDSVYGATMSFRGHR